MGLTSGERVLLHLHGILHAREPGREATQAGISDGARVQRSHVPRALQALLREDLVEARESRLRGRTRKSTVYGLTPAGVALARQLLDALDAEPALVDGRGTTLGEARRILGLTPIAAALSLDERGVLHPPADSEGPPGLVQREEDLAALRRWMAGGATFAVVYGSRGMGKTALGRALASGMARVAWVDLERLEGPEELSKAVVRATGAPMSTAGPGSAADALLAAFDAGVRLLVLDGYEDVPDGIVEALASVVRRARGRPDIRILVLAQETTPAYARFYAHADVEAGTVVERHLRGLDLEGCRSILGRDGIDEESLRRIYLLTKGCPLYLEYIRAGDDAGLRARSRFTKAEIRLLLYSGGIRERDSSAS